MMKSSIRERERERDKSREKESKREITSKNAKEKRK
jgi:hypothetical protein